MGKSFKGENSLPEPVGELFPLRAVLLVLKLNFCQQLVTILNVTVFITHVCICVTGITPMNSLLTSIESRKSEVLRSRDCI